MSRLLLFSVLVFSIVASAASPSHGQSGLRPLFAKSISKRQAKRMTDQSFQIDESMMAQSQTPQLVPVPKIVKGEDLRAAKSAASQVDSQQKWQALSILEKPVAPNRDSVLPSIKVLAPQSAPFVFEFGTVMMFPADDTTVSSSSDVASPANAVSLKPLILPRKTTATVLPQSGPNPPLVVKPTASTRVPVSQVAAPITKPAALNSVFRAPTKRSATQPPAAPAITTPVLPIHRNLDMSIVGPPSLTRGVPESYEITVRNVSSETAKSIVVQMNYSEGMSVTRIDRPAWIDKKANKVSWQLDSLGAGTKEVIQFSAAFSVAGQLRQEIVLGSESVFQGNMEFMAVVADKPIVEAPSK
ncbi:MAG: hypothetical protein ACI87E_000819 [Mariniblastus sp.]|jgi:hypothetical protein